MGWLPDEARKMLDQLVEMALRLGRDPTFTEVDQDPTMPKANSYAYFFGSFTDAQKEAHRIAFVCKKQEPPLPVGKIFSEEEEKEMSRRAITDEEYVVGIIRLQKELGRFPTISDVRSDKRCPSATSYERRFGADWNGVKAAVLRKARDLEINEDNIDNYPPPELKKPKPVKPEPTPVSQIPSPFFGSSSISCEDPLGSIAETPTEITPIKTTSAELALPDFLSGISTEPILLSEVEPEGNKLISLLPQTKIVKPKVSGYATVFVSRGTIPLQKTVLGIPVSRNYSGLNLLINGRSAPFPEPQEGVFYIVEREIASIAKASGRDGYDLLIPEKYNLNENEMTITEFSIL